MTRIKEYILHDKIPIAEPDFDKWLKWSVTNNDKHRVDYTVIENDEYVSTVFLGFDHQYGKGPPLLFETMVFGGKYNEYQWRHSTWEQAETCHNRVVKSLLNGEQLEW